MANSGWSNDIPNPLIVGGNGQTGQIILLDSTGNQNGSLDGSSGLVLVGNGTVANPNFQLSPFGDITWTGSPGQVIGTSVSVGTTTDDVGKTRLSAFLASGSYTTSQSNGCIMSVNSAPADLSEPPCLSLTGVIVGNDPSVSGNFPTPESWHAMTLANGWAAAGGAFDTPSYRITAEGKVDLKGVATGGTHAAGTVVTTLPTGWRPAKTRQLVASADGNTSPFCCLLQVAADGTIKIFQGASASAAIGFDGLSFYLT